MTTGAIVIVGGSRGIGRAAARKLSLDGHNVILTATTEAAATSVATGIANETRHPMTGMQLDVLDPASIHRFAERLPHPVRSVIVGAVHWPEGRQPQMTDTGLERTFAVNVFGAFRLMQAMTPHLIASAKTLGEVRVTLVSSRLHLPGRFGMGPRFDWTDIDLSRRFRPMTAYCNSKLAMIWLAREADRRLRNHGVRVNGLCPGFVPMAVAQRSGVRQRAFMRLLSYMPFATSLDRAAAAYAWAATDPSLAGAGGQFLADFGESLSSEESKDTDSAERLWNWCRDCDEILPSHRP